MPIVDGPSVIARPEQQVTPPTPFSAQMGAALKRENSLGSLWDRLSSPTEAAPTAFDYYDVPTEGEFRVQDYIRPEQQHLLPYLEDAESLEEAQATLDRLQEEVAAQHAIADGPMHPLVAAFGAAALDPVSYLSLGAGAAYRLGRTASFLRRSTAAGFASAVMSEAALQGTQMTRETAESAANIAASILFSGGIAYGFGKLGQKAAPPEQKETAAVYETEMADIMQKKAVNEPDMPQGDAAAETNIDPLNSDVFNSILELQKKIQEQQARTGDMKMMADDPPTPGAAPKEELADTGVPKKEAVTEEPEPELEYQLTLDPEDTHIWAGNLGVVDKLSDYYARAGKVGLAPVATRLITSPFAATRELFLRLGEPSGLKTVGNARGKSMGPADLDTAIKADRNVWHNRFLLDQKKSYSTYAKREKSLGRKPLSPYEFRVEVGKATRRGGRHTIPEVSAVSRSAAQMFDYWKTKAQDAGLEIDDVVKTAESYAPRMWDHNKVVDGYSRLLEIVARRFKEYGDGSPDELVKSRAAETIEGFLKHTASARIAPAYKTDDRGALAERTFQIPDELVEDFLDNDIEAMVSSYLRTMVPDVHLKSTFGKVNPDDGLIPELVYKEAQAAKLENPARQAEYERRARDDVRLLQWQVAELRGLNHKHGDGYDGLRRVGAAIRQYNFARLLGSVVLSSIPDIGRVITQAGFSRTMSVAVAQFGDGLKGLKMSAREAQKYGTAVDLTMSTRVRQIMGMDEPDPGRTATERSLQWLAQKAGLVTGISYWNTALKSISSSETTDWMLRTARKLHDGSHIPQKDMERLAKLRMDPEDLKRVWATQQDKFDSHNGLFFANIEDWSSPDLAAKFRHAAVRQVDDTIITPTATDVPAWANNDIFGRLIFSLKRFIFTATNRILLAGLQDADAKVIQGWTAMLALGMMSTALRDIATRGEVRDRTPRQWITNGIDRSGVLGALMEADSLQGRATGHSLQRLLAGEDADRFAGRGLATQVLGPGAGLLEDTANAARQLGDGYATRADIAAVRRLAPFTTLPGLSIAFREFENGLGSHLPRKRAEAISD